MSPVVEQRRGPSPWVWVLVVVGILIVLAIGGCAAAAIYFITQFSEEFSDFALDDPPAPAVASVEGLPWREVWRTSSSGPLALAVMETGRVADEVLVLYPKGEVQSLDPATGDEQRRFPVDDTTVALATGDLDGDGASELLAIPVTDVLLIAYDRSGEVRWRYRHPASSSAWVLSAWALDVDADGTDEVAVAFDEDEGVHLLDGDGRQRWTHAIRGSSYLVHGADLTGDGQAVVAYPENERRFETLDRDGRVVSREVRGNPRGAEVYAFARGADGPAVYRIGRESGRTEVLLCFDPGGAERWRYDLGPGGTWEFHRMVAGRFLGGEAEHLAVVSSNSVVHLLGAGGAAQSVWAPGTMVVAIATIRRASPAPDWLVVATRDTVTAYELRGSGEAGR